jgi:hypothetical protein
MRGTVRPPTDARKGAGHAADTHVQAKDVALTTSVAQLVKDLGAANKDLLHQNMEFALGIQKLVADQQAAKAEMAVRVVNARRNAELANTALRLAPAAINGIAGAPVFPEAAASDSVLRGLARTITKEQIGHLASLAGGDLNNQMALATLMDQLATIRQQDEAEQARLREYSLDGFDVDAEEAGRPPETEPTVLDRATKGAGTPQLAEKTDGANGENGGGGDADATLWDDLFATVPPGQLGMLVKVLAGQHPDLAKRIEARAKLAKREGARR